jgi:hypothetical protein
LWSLSAADTSRIDRGRRRNIGDILLFALAPGGLWHCDSIRAALDNCGDRVAEMPPYLLDPCDCAGILRGVMQQGADRFVFSSAPYSSAMLATANR